MPFFSYRAIDSNGEITKGVKIGNHIDDVYNSIQTSGLYVLDIYPSSRFTNFIFEKFKGSRVDRKEIIEFASNLSVMLKAGLPIINSLTDITEAIDNRRFKAKLLDIRNSVELGMSFSEAISRHSDIFPDIFIRLIAAGEETGRLSESLADILVHLKRLEDLKNVITRAMIYPLIALTATTGALLFWLVYVLPRLKDLFTTLGTELPPLTKGLIAVSDFAASYWYIFFIIPALLYVVIKLLLRNRAAKYYLDVLKLNLPVLKHFISSKLLALFAEQLRILNAAGITIDRSFDVIIEVVNNEVFRKALRAVKEDIVLGSRISDALGKHSDLFPAMTVRVISVGESTGNLQEQLDYLSRYFIDRLEDISDKMGKMIEPLIILVVGSMFMLIILGLLSPIFDLISAIG